MALLDDLRNEVKRIFKDAWSERDGRVVPEAKDVALSNDAINFDRATVLYADLSGSTSMVQGRNWQFAAEVYRTYLYCAARLIRASEGAVTAYDGDRVMGVFIGKFQSTNAVKCGLKINWAVQEIINPAIKSQYSTDFLMKQVVGIDTSQIRVARTGVRGDNDLVWVGRAANYAAKLTELNLAPSTWITKAVFDKMMNNVKYGGANTTLMWKKYQWTQMENIEIHGSTWRWKI